MTPYPSWAPASLQNLDVLPAPQDLCSTHWPVWSREALTQEHNCIHGPPPTLVEKTEVRAYPVSVISVIASGAGIRLLVPIPQAIQEQTHPRHPLNNHPHLFCVLLSITTLRAVVHTKFLCGPIEEDCAKYPCGLILPAGFSPAGTDDMSGLSGRILMTRKFGAASGHQPAQSRGFCSTAPRNQGA